MNCRSKRRFYGRFRDPPHWIEYMLPWERRTYVALDENNQVRAFRTEWKSIRIDPRGHFTMLRCSIIITLLKIMRRWLRLRKPLMEVCEFFANYPTF